MRLTIHWRGQPLITLDLTAQSPTEPDPSLDPPMGLSGSAGGLQDQAEPMDPDTRVFGIGVRPESAR